MSTYIHMNIYMHACMYAQYCLTLCDPIWTVAPWAALSMGFPK